MATGWSSNALTTTGVPHVGWPRAFATGALVAQATIVALFVATSLDPATRATYTTASVACRVVAVACIVFGLNRYRPRLRTVWLLLLARCTWSALFIPFRNAHVDDLFWWALDGAVGTLLYAVAAAVLVHRRAAARDRSVWLDVAVICLGAAFVVFVYLGAPLLRSRELDATSIVNGAVVPALDVLLIALTLLLAFTLRTRSVALALLIAAFALVPSSDVIVQLAMLGTSGLVVDRSWVPFSLIFTALIGLAALHPSMREIESDAGSGSEPWGGARALLIVGAFLLALGGVLQSPDGARPLLPIQVALVLAAIFLLVVARTYFAVRSMAESHRDAQRAAKHDAASGLLNAAGLAEFYARRPVAIDARRTLFLVRLRQTLEVGQLWGPAARDAWIGRVAAALEAVTRSSGTLARIGLDQFALLLDGRTDAVDAIAARMGDVVGDHHAGGNVTIVSAYDIGIAEGDAYTGFDALLRDAEAALSVSQGQGENRIAHYDAAVASATQRRFALLNNLRNAAARNEFRLHYQPVVDLGTREVVGCEALLRWTSPTLGVVSPAEFIPLAESIDAIEDITAWVLETTGAAIAALAEQGVARQVSVNISARSLQRPGLAERVTSMLERHALTPSHLCLELTERVRMEDPHGELALLRQLGVHLAIDDFGSGYSNLAMLARLAADKIKLDISFVRAVEADATMRRLCSSVLTHLGDGGARVVAEGIETEAQHALLQSLGCHYGQGWLYGRPQPQLV